MRRKIIGLLATVGLLGSTAVLLGGSPASAQRVANTGAGQLIFDNGQIQIRDESFETGSSSDQVIANINVGGNGNFSVGSIQFPPIPPIDGPLGDIDISINLLSASGHVNPLTGLTNLSFSFRIEIDGTGVGGNCHVGPININASSANSGGVPYNVSNGRVTLADHTFSVPEADGCATFPVNVNNEINNELNLPSPSGQNSAVFGGFFDPIRQRAISPSFTATPNSGFAPLDVDFDANGSTGSRPIANYQWDFTNNGSFDATGVTTSFTYATPGSYTARLRVTDDQGDFFDTTRTVTVNTPLPDVSLDKSGSTAIVHGDPGSYDLVVSSVGQLAAAGATVVDTVPAGLTYSGFSGAGWSCLEVPTQTVTCTSTDVVDPGNDFPTLTIDVVADGTVTGNVSNSATASTTGETNVGNNTDTQATQLIIPGIDLELVKVHDEDDGFFLGENATYIISVSNVGTLPATDTILLTDELPPGTTFVGASGGLDWVCNESGGTVGCFSQTDLAAGDSLDDIHIIVELTSVSSPLSNTASVDVTGESNPANNTDTDTGEVEGLAVDYEVLKTHVGDIVVGEPTTYGIGVQNVGTQTGSGTVTVTDELPAGLTHVSSGGDGWSCDAVGQTVTCEHPGDVEAGDVLPGISLQVVADDSLIPSVTNTAAVSGAGDANTANDSDSDTSDVRRPEPDLALSKSHEGNFTTGSDGTWTLVVENQAAERADGPTVVTDSLPAGVDFVSAAGTGWSCDDSALPQVTCTYADVIAGFGAAPPISIVVHAPDGAPDLVVNGATVSNADDTNLENDAAFDPTAIDLRDAAPTVLEADAIALQLRLGLFGAPLKLTLLNAPHAVLTSDGQPVEGREVTFRVLNQTEDICTAVTDADGVASCSGLISLVQALKMLRYTAEFDGDADFEGSYDEGPLVLLGTLHLL